MIDHMQIAAKRRELERDRRAKVREVMLAYDKVHGASLQELHEACSRIGHHWRPQDVEWPDDRVVCQICGAAK